MFNLPGLEDLSYGGHVFFLRAGGGEARKELREENGNILLFPRPPHASPTDAAVHVPHWPERPPPPTAITPSTAGTHAWGAFHEPDDRDGFLRLIDEAGAHTRSATASCLTGCTRSSGRTATATSAAGCRGSSRRTSPPPSPRRFGRARLAWSVRGVPDRGGPASARRAPVRRAHPLHAGLASRRRRLLAWLRREVDNEARPRRPQDGKAAPG